MKYKNSKGKFPMVEDKHHDEMTEISDSVKDAMGKGSFGPEEHGIEERDWPKKFVVDGGLKYDFGGPEVHGVETDGGVGRRLSEADYEGEEIGKTHEYDKSAGRLKAWPKKFKTDGNTDEFDGGE